MEETEKAMEKFRKALAAMEALAPGILFSSSKAGATQSSVGSSSGTFSWRQWVVTVCGPLQSACSRNEFLVFAGARGARGGLAAFEL